MVGPFSCVIIIVIIIIFLVVVIDVVTVAPNSHWREMDSDLDKIGWAGPNSSFVEQQTSEVWGPVNSEKGN